MTHDAWEFWIDRGGTFTDVVGRAPDGALHVEKLLSEAPTYPDAAVEGVRRLLARHGGGRVSAVKMGTTVGTNALLERRGEPTLLAITRGHADALAIGWQSRPRLFDLNIRKPEPLYARTCEITERLTAEGEVWTPLDEDAARVSLQAAYDDGLRAVAVVLIHAHRFPTHEARVAAIAREVGFTQVSASHETAPLIKLVSRGDTTVVDAYLSPVLARYVAQVRDALHAVPGCEETRLLFMQSSGGLAAADAFRGKDAVLSGPAGGVVGLAATATEAGFSEVIGFDMGGTSTDVSRYAGQFERTSESEVAGVRLRAPMMALHTVAAGGGSICRFDGARLRVGPQSAGADPGSAAYRRGGPLTVTDCNFMLGRLQPDLFPSVFGPDADQPPDLDAVRTAFAELAAEVEAATGRPQTPETLAEGFLTVAVESMAKAIREISVQKGYDATGYTLVSFGGAGGQHACAVAGALGMTRVMVHPLAGVLSAYGMGRADLRAIRERTVDLPLDAASWGEVRRVGLALAGEAVAALRAQGLRRETIVGELALGLKYAGVDAPLQVACTTPEQARANFEALHEQRFGFTAPEKAVVVDRVIAEAHAPGERSPSPRVAEGEAPRSTHSVTARLGGEDYAAPVYDRDTLPAGASFYGPALVREATGAVLVEIGWAAKVDALGNLVLTRSAQGRGPRLRGDERMKDGASFAGAAPPIPPAHPREGGDLDPEHASERDMRRPDPVRLEVFAQRFMAIAERMGFALQNTAYSVNIKERLDFSCALFDPSANLIANAPHMPVHLGSMGESVRAILRSRTGDGRGLVPGDVYMLNDPYNGGAHLPDVTVIAPVYDDARTEILAFVAARGHQADIGGRTPGSMPPDSTTVDEEGVLINDALLVEGEGVGGGRLLEAQTRALLGSGPWPARNPDQNIADLKAQIAACAKGAAEFKALVAGEGRSVVDAYMAHVQDNAAEAVRRAIDAMSDGTFRYEMDSGAAVQVAVRVDRASRTAVVDFTGTSAQLSTNFNAPYSVARAAVLYVFRTLVDDDIPLNDGCLRPVTLIVPEGSMLRPRHPAAVVAGNVETSQVVVDALYGALGVVAASQGTMNNFTFGDATRQYYETICGGAGAGPGFDGASAVQTHMTNSRLTDPEVLETRYPVLLERFAVRTGSGGRGAYRGGDGVVRRVVFREPMTAAILANRRRVPPYGLAGGEPGATGAARVERADGKVEALGSTEIVTMRSGDAFVVETPGGGGFGEH